MNKKLFFATLLMISLFLIACSRPIDEIKDDKYVDKSVTISGDVKGSVKLGSLSGYTLQDDSGEIFVASVSLPEDGSKKTVSGKLKKVPLLGTYYIETT